MRTVSPFFNARHELPTVAPADVFWRAGLSAMDDFIYGYMRGVLFSDGVDVDVPDGVNPRSTASLLGRIAGVSVDQAGYAFADGAGSRGPAVHVRVPCACFAAGTSVENCKWFASYRAGYKQQRRKGV